MLVRWASAALYYKLLTSLGVVVRCDACECHLVFGTMPDVLVVLLLLFAVVVVVIVLMQQWQPQQEQQQEQQKQQSLPLLSTAVNLIRWFSKQSH